MSLSGRGQSRPLLCTLPCEWVCRHEQREIIERSRKVSSRGPVTVGTITACNRTVEGARCIDAKTHRLGFEKRCAIVGLVVIFACMSDVVVIVSSYRVYEELASYEKLQASGLRHFMQAAGLYLVPPLALNS
ncbi:hypothetical protein AVEN_15410-1 [Araneus ventricosus]|uniref:Uncharacterized protein n=1 Tax=Araneus ventricosus TaxID=182803 RepID=A0A4Y2CTF3_ARAVE|nr:hypothetical protein AVEN_15410-1 [Araneus ventricosus]